MQESSDRAIVGGLAGAAVGAGMWLLAAPLGTPLTAWIVGFGAGAGVLLFSRGLGLRYRWIGAATTLLGLIAGSFAMLRMHGEHLWLIDYLELRTSKLDWIAFALALVTGWSMPGWRKGEPESPAASDP